MLSCKIQIETKAGKYRVKYYNESGNLIATSPEFDSQAKAEQSVKELQKIVTKK
jgi:uncharacterized protein YegP (UPF0339 family)